MYMKKLKLINLDWFTESFNCVTELSYHSFFECNVEYNLSISDIKLNKILCLVNFDRQFPRNLVIGQFSDIHCIFKYK